jgi:hypothetical protein
MRLHDTVLRMRELLTERGVDLTPERASARASYEGPGANAQQAWEAFGAVAVEPALDPIRAWGDVQPVKSAGFLFEAMFSQGWPASRHSPNSRGMPEHYELMFTRQFSVGEAGDMMGLSLTVFVPAADELRTLKDSFFGGDDSDPATFTAGAKAWIAQVEASPAFIIPMTRHEADRFSFGVDGIG